MLKRLPKGGTEPILQCVISRTCSGVARLSFFELMICFSFFMSTFLSPAMTAMRYFPFDRKMSAFAPCSMRVPRIFAASSDVWQGW